VIAKSASTRSGANELLYPTEDLAFLLSLPLNADGIWSPPSLAFVRTGGSFPGVKLAVRFFVIFASQDTCYDSVLNKTNYYFPHASQFSCNNPVILHYAVNKTSLKQ
jgi:hypothetical protein